MDDLKIENELSSETQDTKGFDALSREEIVKKLKAMLSDGNVERMPVEALKSAFYKKMHAENTREKTDAENELPAEPDALEVQLKEVLAQIKEKRRQLMDAQQKEESANLEKKMQIVEKLKDYVQQVNSSENVSALVMDVRALQQEWKEIGAVNPSQKSDLTRKYQALLDEFYDFIKINNDLRDYDFKKNLEIKTELCQKAEALAQDEDVVSALKVLQTLHKEWSETGPVARELREDLWMRFKTATAQINKKHQQYFENRKKEEEQNEEAKTKLCEEAEHIDYSALKTFKDWDEKSKAVVALQEKWKEIGFVSRKSKVFDRFRAACNEFFQRKNEYFKQIKSDLNENLAKKIALCERAEALKDNTDWKSTSDRLIKLQKEWKTIGAVSRKHSDEVWKRFTEACDYFFERRNRQSKQEHEEEQQNLEKKLDILERLKALDCTNGKNTVDDVKQLMAEWNETGHVPFDKKDEVYDKYYSAVRAKFNEMKADGVAQQLQMFRVYAESLNAEKEIEKAYRRLQKDFERLKSEINGYENNMSFFSFDSKKANSLKKDLEKNIERLKEEKDMVWQKLQILKEKIK